MVRLCALHGNSSSSVRAMVKVSHMTTCVVNHIYLSDWAYQNWICKAQVTFPDGNTHVYQCMLLLEKLALPLTGRGKSEALLWQFSVFCLAGSLPLDDFIYILSIQCVIILNITASVSSVSLSSNNQIWGWSWWHQNFIVRVASGHSFPKFYSGKPIIYNL